MDYTITAIGRTFANENGFGVALEPEYRRALTGLEGFSHVQIVWWFSECDCAASRKKLTEAKPYRNAPEVLGTFATRAPERPNPIAISTVRVTEIDAERGVIGLAWIDAFDGTPVLDIKPYTPAFDRVEAPEVPAWCSHWPKSEEASGSFDWAEEFNF